MKVKARVFPVARQVNSKVIAIANLTLNDEIAVRNVKLVDGTNGFNFLMPSDKTDQGWKAYCFPCTTEARAEILNEIIARYRFPINEQDMYLVGRYEEALLNESDRLTEYSVQAKQYVLKDTVDIKDVNTIRKLYDLQSEAYKNREEFLRDIPQSLRETDEKSTFKVYVYKSTVPTKKVATAQLTIDDEFVIKGISLINSLKGGEQVIMPSWVDKEGEWHDIVYPINAEVSAKIKELIINKYRSLGDIRGNVKFSELGTGEDVLTVCGLENDLAKQIMDNLEAAGVKYSAKITATTAISFNKNQKDEYKKIHSETRKNYQAAEKGVDENEKSEPIQDKDNISTDTQSKKTADEDTIEQMEYKVEANPNKTNANNSHFIQQYFPSESGSTFRIGDPIYIGSYQKCIELAGLLECGRATPEMVKDLFKQEQAASEPTEEEIIEM